MADVEQVRDAGRRLAADLRELREERGIQADAILEATRLTADIFEAFDDAALVDHPAFNRVYLRSIVSSYARVLEIEESDVLSGLEEALDGSYHGALRRKYLEKLNPGDGPSFALIDAGEDEGEARKSSGAGRAARSFQDSAAATPKERVDRSEKGNSGRIVSIILGIAAIILIIWWLKTILVPPSSPVENEPVIPAPVVSQSPPPEPEWIVLGDSIRFDIIASTEPLDPIRVKVDRDMRRPYWIEHQDTMTFYARNEILFERELDVAEILMEGYLLSDSLVDQTGQLVLTRARAQAWLDSLAVRSVSFD